MLILLLVFGVFEDSEFEGGGIFSDEGPSAAVGGHIATGDKGWLAFIGLEPIFSIAGIAGV